MLSRSAFDSSSAAGWFSFATDARRPERLDLRGRLSTAIGHDLLENPDPLLELSRAGRILRSLLGGIQRLDLELLLTEFEEAVGDDHQQDNRQSDNDRGEQNRSYAVHQAFPPLSI